MPELPDPTGGRGDLSAGTEFVAEIKTSALGARLIKFTFNVTDTLMLEFGDGYIRFYQDGAPVVVGGVPYELAVPYGIADVDTLATVQSADVVTIVHPNYPPAELKRFSDTNWTYTPINFAPSIAAPTGIAVVGTPSLTDHVWRYAVTAISATTGEESLADVDPNIHPRANPSATSPITVTWNPESGVVAYNVYAAIDYGTLGFLASVPGGSSGYMNTGLQTPDPTTTPPQPFTDFVGTGNYPGVVNYYQQRLLFANTRNNPARVWASRSGNYHNFTTSTPITDDGPIVFTMVSDEIDEIQHMLNLGKLIIGTQGAEWLVDGDANGVMTPAAINDRIGSYNGANGLKPVKVDNTILYVQSQGGKVLELKTNILYGYYTFQGSDLTLISAHLFKGLSIVDWDYQQQPNYTVWAVRSDGVLLSLTYLPDQQLVAWARHDTVGAVEHVCVIPELVGSVPYLSDSVYLIVRRVINGQTKRYVERMRPLEILDYTADPVFMDCALEYDGRNAGGSSGITMTLTNT